VSYIHKFIYLDGSLMNCVESVSLTGPMLDRVVEEGKDISHFSRWKCFLDSIK